MFYLYYILLCVTAVLSGPVAQENSTSSEIAWWTGKHVGRCGSNGPPLNGKDPECNPDNPDGHCCSAHGWCGVGPAFCDCSHCTNYRNRRTAMKFDKIQGKVRLQGVAGGRGAYCRTTINTELCSCCAAVAMITDARILGEASKLVEISSNLKTIVVPMQGSLSVICTGSPEAYWTIKEFEEQVKKWKTTLELYLIEKRMIAVCHAEEGERSSTQKLMIEISKATPSDPVDVVVIVEDGSVNITWNPPQHTNGNIIRYEVTLLGESATDPVKFNRTPTQRFLHFPKGGHLEPDVDYSVKIVAVSQYGEGVPSQLKHFRIPENS